MKSIHSGTKERGSYQSRRVCLLTVRLAVWLFVGLLDWLLICLLDCLLACSFDSLFVYSFDWLFVWPIEIVWGEKACSCVKDANALKACTQVGLTGGFGIAREDGWFASERTRVLQVGEFYGAKTTKMRSHEPVSIVIEYRQPCRNSWAVNNYV